MGEALGVKVGVVVPIYNVEKYLKQCLDSIIHQTYTNLSIILINDGSKDKSLEIALEYALRDERIIIFDKENGGLSSARNVGIEFFSGEYTIRSSEHCGELQSSKAKRDVLSFANDKSGDISLVKQAQYDKGINAKNSKTLNCHSEAEVDCHSECNEESKRDLEANKESQRYFATAQYDKGVNIQYDKGVTQYDKLSQAHKGINTFKIIGENPYQIQTIYSLKSSLEIPNIDYLQFVDSDDYIELDTIEQSLAKIQDADVLWFDTHLFYDKCDKVEHFTNIQHYHYKKEKMLTSKEWLKRSEQNGLGFFWYSYHGLIKFEFLRAIKLKFIDGIVHEDNIFGTLLFANASKIYVYPKDLYHYRIRPNSIMNYNNASLESSPPSKYLAKIYDAFERLDEAKAYHKAYSWAKSALALNTFLKRNKNRFQNRLLKECFLKTFCLWALELEKFSADPLEIKTQENLKFLKKNARGFINAYFFGKKRIKVEKKLRRLYAT